MCNLFLQDRHAGRTPRWRGVTALHELKAAGRRDDDRQRQHARSVLRLWRSRHARSLARGRAHPASGLPVRGLGRRRLGDAGAGDARAAAAPCGRRARRHDLDAGARFHGIVRAAAERIAWWCATASRSTPSRRIMPNSTVWRVLRHDARLRHRRLSRRRRRPQDRGQSDAGQTEEPRLLLVLAGAEAPARRRLGRRHGDAAERGRGARRAGGGLSLRHSGDAARRGDRQLRAGDAAQRRRAAEPRRDEPRQARSRSAASSASPARC